MKQSTLAVIIGGAVVLVAAIVIIVRMEAPSDQEEVVRRPAERMRHTEPTPAPDTHDATADRSSSRVRERLARLREEYQERHTAPMPNKPDVSNLAKPTVESRRPPNDDQELSKLEQTMLTNNDPDERMTAVFFISTADSKVAVPILLKGMTDSDPEVRLAVLEALDDYSEELTPRQLYPALHDSDAEVRFEALGIVGEMDDPEAMLSVKDALKDPDEDVRSLAEGILDFSDESPK